MLQVGRFEARRLVAAGSLGELHLASVGPGPATKALLLVRPALAMRPEVSRALLEEAITTRGKAPEGAAAVEAAGYIGDRLYACAPYVDGAALEAMGPLPIPVVAYVAASIARCLAEAHEVRLGEQGARWVHGAVTPRTVRVDRDGRPWLVGLGLGQTRWAAPVPEHRRIWRAPEHRSGGLHGPACDAWGLARTVLAALGLGPDRVLEAGPLAESLRIRLGEDPAHRTVGLAAWAEDLSGWAAPAEEARAALAARLPGGSESPSSKPARSRDTGPAWTLDLPDAGGARRLGRYRLVEHFEGSGARGVYRAVDPNLGREVVVHTLEREGAEAAASFKAEAKRVAQLEHPRLPQILDAGRLEGQFFTVYRCFPGRSLAELLAEKGKLPARTVARAASDWGRALDALHRAGFLHGDLRASNLLFDPEEGGFVVDLSESCSVGASDVPSHPFAHAPETVDGNPATAASERFAFGAVLFEALVGERPFRARSVEGILAAIAEASPPYPEPATPLEARVWAVVRSLLDPDPGRRPEDLGVAAERLEAALDPVPVSQAGEGVADAELLRAFVASVGGSDGLRLARQARALAEAIAPASALGPVVSAAAAFSTRASPPAPETVPEWCAPVLEQLHGGGAMSRAASIVWVARAVLRRAAPPHGEGTLPPRVALDRIREEAGRLRLDPAVWPALRAQMGLPKSGDAIPAPGEDVAILLAGGDETWRQAIAAEGYRVVPVANGEQAWSELQDGRYFGAVLPVQLDGLDGRALLRAGRGRGAALRQVRFALVGGELEPEDHGPFTWAIPVPSPEAIRAVVRGWRVP